jgi:hypothetical protein
MKPKRTAARPPQLTLADAADPDPGRALLLCNAALLGKRPRCDNITAAQHAEAVRARYGLPIDDLRLRVAVACGGFYHLYDKHQARWADQVIEWWVQSYTNLRALLSIDSGTGSAEPILAGLVAEYIALSKRVGAYTRNMQPRILDEDQRCDVKAIAAYYVVRVLQFLQQLNRRHPHRDWRTTVRVLEYYGHDCGSANLREKADALRKLVERRTRRAS